MNARADWRTTVAGLTPGFAARAAQLDEGDEFVAENYQELKASGLYAAGVPRELGGDGLELAELCEMVRTIARACSSTGLAFSMHTHQVGLNAWRLKHQKAPVAPLLEKVARDKVLILTTGGGDWLDSSGEAVKAEGGYRVNARKPFSSIGCTGAFWWRQRHAATATMCVCMENASAVLEQARAMFLSISASSGISMPWPPSSAGTPAASMPDARSSS